MFFYLSNVKINKIVSLHSAFRLSLDLNFLLPGDCQTLSQKLLCKTRKPGTRKVSLIMTWNISHSIKSQPPSYFFVILLIYPLTGGPPFKRTKRGLTSTPFFIYQDLFLSRRLKGVILVKFYAWQSCYSFSQNGPQKWIDLNPPTGFHWGALLSTPGRESQIILKLFKKEMISNHLQTEKRFLISLLFYLCSTVGGSVLPWTNVPHFKEG